MSHWANRYVGIPWVNNRADLEGCSCWGLVHLVLKREAGIETPGYDAVSSDDIRAAAKAVRHGRALGIWTPVPLEEARRFDVVTMLGMDTEPGRVPSHVGVVVSPGLMLHVELKTHAVCVRMDDLRVRHRIVEVCRHQGLLCAGGAQRAENNPASA